MWIAWIWLEIWHNTVWHKISNCFHNAGTSHSGRVQIFIIAFFFKMTIQNSNKICSVDFRIQTSMLSFCLHSGQRVLRWAPVKKHLKTAASGAPGCKQNFKNETKQSAPRSEYYLNQRRSRALLCLTGFTDAAVGRTRWFNKSCVCWLLNQLILES